MSDTPDGQATGWAAVPRWVLWETELSASARLVLVVLVVLVARENRVGECWPSHARLASDTALSVTTVKGALRELRAAGRELMQMSKE